MVVLSRGQWNYFQRLILLLQSDAYMEIEKRKHWSVTQLDAAVALLVFGLCVARVGFGYQMLALAVPFGVVSIALSGICARSRPLQFPPEEIATMPFSSVSEILAVRRRVSNFSKGKYPANLESRRIRSLTMDDVIH